MANLFHVIEINAESSKVFDLIKDLNGIAKWWTQDSSIISEKPLTYHFRFPTGAQNKMEQIELRENHSILWKCIDGHEEWVGTQISFELTKKESGTQLRFKQFNWEENSDFLGLCNHFWGHYLNKLKAVAESDSEAVKFGFGISMPLRPSEREKAETFYKDILGCKEVLKNESYSCYKFPNGQVIGVTPDENAPTEEQYENSTWLEIVSNNVDTTKKKLLAFGVREVKGGMKDAFFFNAPGGAVFRLLSEEQAKNEL